MRAVASFFESHEKHFNLYKQGSAISPFSITPNGCPFLPCFLSFLSTSKMSSLFCFFFSPFSYKQHPNIKMICRSLAPAYRVTNEEPDVFIWLREPPSSPLSGYSREAGRGAQCCAFCIRYRGAGVRSVALQLTTHHITRTALPKIWIPGS